MGGKRKQAQMLFQKITKPRPEVREDVSSKEAWDRYYTMTGCDFYSESHADWPQLRTVITRHLSSSPPPASILVPACGNSRLSEQMYDAGFTSITNVDFSSLVIAHMLNRNVSQRPQMKWRVGDMTKLEQYANETFDVVVDKGGLDGLMIPELAPLSVTRYLYEVKRLLKAGGKYMCVTFGEINVLDILFLKFRFGWNVSLHAIGLDSSPGDIKQQAFIVVAEKLACTAVSQISLSLADYEAQRHVNTKADEFYGALEREEMIRSICSDDSDLFTPLEDLVLVAKAKLSKLGASHLFYDCILIDAPVDSLSLSEGQGYIVKACKAARLLMVILEPRHADMSRKDIMIDISPVIKKLDPACANGGECWISVEKDKASTSETENLKQRDPHYSSSEPHGEASSSSEIKIDHSYLASPHTGLMLIYEDLGGSTSVEIMVVEKDPLTLHLFREYFGFGEDERLKVHIGDGVQFVRQKTNSGAESKVSSEMGALIVDSELPHSWFVMHEIRKKSVNQGFDDQFYRRGSSSLVSRISSHVLIVGVDSLSTVIHPVGGRRQFHEDIHSEIEEKLVVLCDGVHAAATGDIDMCNFVIDILKTEIGIRKLAGGSMSNLAEIGMIATAVFQSRVLEPDEDHKSFIFIFGWIKEAYQRYDVIIVGDDYTHPVLIPDDVFGAGGGHKNGLDYLRKAAIKDTDHAHAVDAVIDGMMICSASDPYTGGRIRVYRLVMGESTCVYEYSILDTITTPGLKSYRNLIFRENSVIFLFPRRFKQDYGPEDLFVLIHMRIDSYSRGLIHWFDQSEEYCAFIAYFRSREECDEWFDLCHEHEGLPLSISCVQNVDGRFIPYGIAKATERNYLFISNLKSVEDILNGRWDEDMMVA